MSKCKQRMEVWARVVGYYQKTESWNKGKKAEFEQRKTYRVNEEEWKNGEREPDVD